MCGLSKYSNARFHWCWNTKQHNPQMYYSASNCFQKPPIFKYHYHGTDIYSVRCQLQPTILSRVYADRTLSSTFLLLFNSFADYHPIFCQIQQKRQSHYFLSRHKFVYLLHPLFAEFVGALSKLTIVRVTNIDRQNKIKILTWSRFFIRTKV